MKTRWIGWIAALVMCANAGYAQTVTGTVTGTVTDQSGAVIPGAKVVALNVETGVASSANSDAAGVYRVAFLPIGRYQLTVQASGFGKQSVPPFQLEAVQTATFNVKLSVGSDLETVTVKLVNARPVEPLLAGRLLMLITVGGVLSAVLPWNSNAPMSLPSPPRAKEMPG